MYENKEVKHVDIPEFELIGPPYPSCEDGIVILNFENKDYYKCSECNYQWNSCNANTTSK